MPTDNHFLVAIASNEGGLPVNWPFDRSNPHSRQDLRLGFACHAETGTVVALEHGLQVPAMITTNEAAGRELPPCWY
jgi:hypothetical protein